MMDLNARVWAPHPTEGFKMGHVIDITSDCISIEPIDEPGSAISARWDRVFPAADDDDVCDDNCALVYLNEATLLNNVRLLYKRDAIYSYVANILIAVNPYKAMPLLYDEATVLRYRGKSLGTLPPHVFAVADKAFRDMRALKQSQSIVVSGESGAGKTESTKHVLKYLTGVGAVSAASAAAAGRGVIERRIVESNPLLEAFGNAKTVRNNNSSRFGKFIEIHYDEKYQVVGGHISHYLLEKSRICLQGCGERNYHIFYRLCAGAPEPLRKRLSLGSDPRGFLYLNRGCADLFKSGDSPATEVDGGLRDASLDDVSDFAVTDAAMTHCGMGDEERMSIYETVAAVLHLGNVSFDANDDDSRGGCSVVGDLDDPLQPLCTAARLLGVAPEELREALTSRVMQTAKGGYKGTVIKVPLKVHEAQNARDALAKAIYSRLFDHIVRGVNKAIPFRSSTDYIGVLDIAGFEYFQKNSFEQFCINYCNEKLQQFFNERILKEEQALYEREGLNVKRIVYVDNQDCISLIESKAMGILDILDEESKLPCPTFDHFTNMVHQQNKGHFRLDFPRKSKLKVHRDLRDDQGFLIRHFAGAVCYETQQFIEKNNDALHQGLEFLMIDSKNKFVRDLFESSATTPAQTKKPLEMRGSTKAKPSKLNFISVGSNFRKQLNQLMEKLSCSGTHFVRCIKPNPHMISGRFEGAQILSQLQCSGMASVLDLMQQGYPSRAPFQDVYNKYKAFMPKKLLSLDPRMFCKALFKALGLNDVDFKFGLTKIFFRPGKFAEFDSVMKSDPEHLKELVGQVMSWLLRHRWRKAQWGVLSIIKLKNKILYRRENVVILQKNFRMLKEHNRHAPRYMGIGNLKLLGNQMESMKEVATQLKGDAGDRHRREVAALEAGIEREIEGIRKNPRMSSAEIVDRTANIMVAIDEELKAIKIDMQQQKNQEEREQLRKIQEEVKREREKKEAEEEKKRKEEEDRRKRAELEARRKLEEEESRRREEERLRQEEEDRKTAEALQRQLSREKAEEESRQRREQEQRDHELAMRLATETNSEVESLPSTLRRSQTIVNERQSNLLKKHDLSKWKYAELRDTINTSCDMELLESCREEFHRRLKVYHQWKTANKRHHVAAAAAADERAPRDIIRHAAFAASVNGAPANEARYFRVPFTRNAGRPTADGPQGVKRGWWYAHFNGRWIQRQMEIYPNAPAVLLIAGKDDMQMCELALDETGLTNRKGAEILETDFEREWKKHEKFKN